MKNEVDDHSSSSNACVRYYQFTNEGKNVLLKSSTNISSKVL